MWERILWWRRWKSNNQRPLSFLGKVQRCCNLKFKKPKTIPVIFHNLSEESDWKRKLTYKSSNTLLIFQSFDWWRWGIGRGNNKIELYLGRLNEKGEHIVTFTQKGGKRRYFADCPSLQGVIKKGETQYQKKKNNNNNNDRHWHGKCTSKITGSFLQTEWYWNSNVELVHRKSWSESHWWSLYNSREIKHKKSFWLSLMEGGM